MGPAPDPELDTVTAAFLAAGAEFVVIGGFAVVAHQHVRATQDVDLLIGDDSENDARCVAALRHLNAERVDPRGPLSDDDLRECAHLRVLTSGGLVDLLREGLAPLDFATVSRGALWADLGAGPFRVAGLATVVALKRLAGRPVDRLDLEALTELHGELPIVPLPGIDAPG